MPETKPKRDPSPQTLKRRIRTLEKECDALQAQVDAMSTETTSRWLDSVQHKTNLIRKTQNSISWRITKPLRIGHTLATKLRRHRTKRANEIGVPHTDRGHGANASST